MAAVDLLLLLLPEREREGDSERQKEIDGKREKQAHRYLVSVQMEKRRQHLNCTDAKGADGADTGCTSEIIFSPHPCSVNNNNKTPFSGFPLSSFVL